MKRVTHTTAAVLALAISCVAAAAEPPKIAALVTVYGKNSHADVIVSRALQTDTLDGRGQPPRIKLVSLYVDQGDENVYGRQLASKQGVRLSPTLEDALTLGTGKLAVDGVLLIAEHGNYPVSPTGNTQYPKRRFFEACAKVFEASGRGVPVFIDKHVADNWADAKWIYDQAAKWKAPLMAGSSLPVLWRYPEADVPRGAKLREIVAISYHTLDHYGFHALEMAQCLAERRAGGETGVKSVRCLSGPAVWEAADRGEFDAGLFKAAFGRLRIDYLRGRDMREMVKSPDLFLIEHADGLKVNIVTLNGAAGEWSVAWRTDDGREESTLFWTQEARPGMHFAHLYRGIEEMFLTGKPTWPVERTMLTSGALDALLQSKLEGGKPIDTPYLNLAYQNEWNWKQPPPPPPNRPFDGE